MVLGTLEASLLGNMLTGKWTLKAGYGNKEGKGVLRTGYGNKYFQFKKIFWFYPIPWQNLKFRSVIRMNFDLMEFILEISCLKKQRIRHL